MVTTDRTVKQFVTDVGRSVRLVRTRDGRLIVRKRAAPEQVAEVLEQARHLEFLRDAGYGDIYPKVLKTYPNGYDMTYLAEASIPVPRPEELALMATDRLFEIAGASERRPEAENRDNRSRFVCDAWKTRLTRLRAAQRTAKGDLSGLIATLLFHLEETSTHTLHDTAILRLAVHGDFVLPNIVASRDVGVAFIDIRGVWLDGRPSWDPILDLASMVAFHCRLIDCGGSASGIRERYARINEQSFMHHLQRAQSFQEWTAHDPGWSSRLEKYVLLRLVGKVGSALRTSARDPEGEARCAAIAARAQLLRLTRTES